MKKILILFSAVILGATVANAQIQKGNVLVGTDIANFNLGLNSGSAFNINLDPKAAWFIKNNVALGGYVNFGISGAENSSTFTTYGVGALGRVYANSAATDVLRHTRFFGEANIGLAGENISKGGNSTNGLGFGFGPGIAYFITPTIGLEGLLKYNGNVGFGNQPYTSALNLNFGFQIYLPGRSTLNKVKSDVNK